MDKGRFWTLELPQGPREDIVFREWSRNSQKLLGILGCLLKLGTVDEGSAFGHLA